MFAILTKYIGTNTSLNRYILWGRLGKYKVTATKDVDIKWMQSNGIAIDKHLNERLDILPTQMYIDGREWFLSNIEIIKSDGGNKWTTQHIDKITFKV